MTHPDTMPCAFHVLRFTAQSWRVDDHGSRAVDIMCKRHDRTPALRVFSTHVQAVGVRAHAERVPVRWSAYP